MCCVCWCCVIYWFVVLCFVCYVGGVCLDECECDDDEGDDESDDGVCVMMCCDVNVCGKRWCVGGGRCCVWCFWLGVWNDCGMVCDGWVCYWCVNWSVIGGDVGELSVDGDGWFCCRGVVLFYCVGIYIVFWV